MELLSRSDAVRAGLKRFFTGTACSAGHVSERYTCDSKCCECVGQKQRDRNKDKAFRDRKNQRMRESGYMTRYYEKYREQHSDKLREMAKESRKRRRSKGLSLGTAWSRAKQNAAKRVREAVLMQLSRAVGCDAQEFKKYMESKFSRGMTWENYGTAWEVDHIVPLAKFDLTTREGLAAASHYTNLQPLWTADNAEKSDSLPERHHPELPIGFSHSL